MPTQKARVLKELRNAGKEGVRSDRFYEMHIPRAGARILELKEEGWIVSSTREKQFTRYCLENVERGADRVPALVKQGCQVQTGGSLSLDTPQTLSDNEAATPLSASLPPGGRPSANDYEDVDDPETISVFGALSDPIRGIEVDEDGCVIVRGVRMEGTKEILELAQRAESLRPPAAYDPWSDWA